MSSAARPIEVGDRITVNFSAHGYEGEVIRVGRVVDGYPQEVLLQLDPDWIGLDPVQVLVDITKAESVAWPAGTDVRDA